MVSSVVVCVRCLGRFRSIVHVSVVVAGCALCGRLGFVDGVFFVHAAVSRQVLWLASFGPPFVAVEFRDHGRVCSAVGSWWWVHSGWGWYVVGVDVRTQGGSLCSLLGRAGRAPLFLVVRHVVVSFGQSCCYTFGGVYFYRSQFHFGLSRFYSAIGCSYRFGTGMVGSPVARAVV